MARAKARRDRALTLARVRKLLDFDPVTGDLTYRADHCGGIAGQVAGDRIMIDGRTYATARVSAFHLTGKWPPGERRENKRPPLTAERLRQVLHYDPKTGRMTWRVPRPGRPAGSEAGSPNSLGYVLVSVDGRRYRRARLAFLYMKGHFPKEECDHRNGIVDDDRWSNLREASRAQNAGNRRYRNRYGVRGVRRAGKKWVAVLRAGGKLRYLGQYNTLSYGRFDAAKRRGEGKDHVSAADQRLGNRLADLILADIAAEAHSAVAS
jgi:hypothetical protein